MSKSNSQVSKANRIWVESKQRIKQVNKIEKTLNKTQSININMSQNSSINHFLLIEDPMMS